VCSSLADSDGAVATGQYGGLVAAADTANATATTWSIVLRTTEANQAPSAAFTYTCDGTDCQFDGRGSTDVDGSVVSHAWDFGDGGTASGTTAGHDFLTSGTRDVTLTVTDDEGTQGTLLVPVPVVRNNAAPTASFTATCAFLACTFDANASGDTDGTVASYAWEFGEDETETATGATPSHNYAAAGAYVVTLTVTDNDGSTGFTTRNVAPAAVRPIAHVGSSANQGNVSTPNTVVPTGTTTGDRLVMVLSLNDATRTVGTTTGVTGWTLVESVVSGTMRTNLYTKVAAAGDGGRTVRFALDAAAKYTLSVAAYTGDLLAPQLASAAETLARREHTTPSLEASGGDWVVSYWADKSSATTAFTLPSGVVQRQAICNTNTGRICSSLADSGTAVPAGPYAGLTATADGASSNATMWTVLLRQAG
jgi:PKD repeat protein